MQVKVVVLNLWHGGKLFENMVNFLKEQNADLLLLQEATNEHDPSLKVQHRIVDELKLRLNLEHSAFAPAFISNLPTGEKVVNGNAILSRFPVTAQNITFMSEPYREDYTDVPENFPTCPRNLQHVMLASPEGELNVFNIQGPWDLDGSHFGERRQKMRDIILEQIKNKAHVIFGGDTNATPDNPAIRALQEQLHDPFKDELKSTFNMKRKSNPGYATAAVDMLLVSSDIQVLEHACPQVDISDHLPLTATLKIA